MHRTAAFVFAIFLAVATTPATAQESLRLPDLGDAASGALSVPEEKRLGEQLIRQVRLRVPMVDDPELRHYVQDLGERLASRAGTPDMTYNFFVVDSPAINAFAMPGGYIGINRGLIERTRSESELAAVMAHEIAHVSQRHIARRLDDSRGGGLQTLGIILAAILMGTQDSSLGSAAAIGGIAGSIQEQLNYSRNHEREADNIGIRILADAGLDPEGMPRFFERLAEATQYQQQPPEYLSTHPVTESRIAESRERASRYRDSAPDESATYGLIRARMLVQRSNEPKDAIRHFRAAVDGASEEQSAFAARFGLALAKMADEQLEAAREDLEALLGEDGERVSYYIALAEVQREAGEPQAGLETLQLGLDLYPGNYPLTLHTARALLRLDRPMDARHLVRRHTQRHGGDAELYRLHAEAATSAGLRYEGLLALSEHHYQRGNLHLAMDQLDRVANASNAEIHERSRAVSRRQDIQRELERERYY
ncbi:M48 family metalloprotease [Aquisalimonas sp.]|uniref:M48 family metalloprotease n=1 Tax=Aquisalimonas sp. TaxID=1872621 RepID=UPI0025C4182B|nr:M48 family metalloprotease [Aquisalimonas sp.]